jgi:competence ComEA-like helix-hairpin-helix protein
MNTNGTRTLKPGAARTAWTAVALAAAFFAGLAGVLAAEKQEPEDHAAAAFKRVCANCHDAERILSARRTRTQWEEVIDKMVERGAAGTDEDFTATTQYLLRVSGRVNVNRALSNDIVDVLGLTPKDADAILEYRKSNGEFKDFDDLCKVPGIDLEKLKQGRDAVSF